MTVFLGTSLAISWSLISATYAPAPREEFTSSVSIAPTQIISQQARVPRVSLPRGSSRDQNRADGARVDALLKEITDFRPQTSAFMMDAQGALEEARQRLETFNTEMDAAITPELVRIANGETPQMRRAANRSDGWARVLADRMAAIDLTDITTETNDGFMMSRFMTIYFQKAGLDKLQRIYPNSSDIRAANEVADGIIAQLGGVEGVRAQGQANRAAELARVRLYNAMRSDPALERAFAAALPGSPFMRRYGGVTVLETRLTNSGWTVERHPVTGVILSRDQQANLAFRTSDGRCFSYLGRFEQRYQGSGYGPVYLKSGTAEEMLCENVPQ